MKDDTKDDPQPLEPRDVEVSNRRQVLGFAAGLGALAFGSELSLGKSLFLRSDVPHDVVPVNTCTATTSASELFTRSVVKTYPSGTFTSTITAPAQPSGSFTATTPYGGFSAYYTETWVTFGQTLTVYYTQGWNISPPPTVTYTEDRDGQGGATLTRMLASWSITEYGFTSRTATLVTTIECEGDKFFDPDGAPDEVGPIEKIDLGLDLSDPATRYGPPLGLVFEARR